MLLVMEREPTEERKSQVWTGSQRLGKRLRELRMQHGLAQLDVAEQIGASNSYMSVVERGERMPSRKRLQQLADIYNVPPLELFELAGLVGEDVVEGVPVTAPPEAAPVLRRLAKRNWPREMWEKIEALAAALALTEERLADERTGERRDDAR